MQTYERTHRKRKSPFLREREIYKDKERFWERKKESKNEIGKNREREKENV